MLRRAWWSSSAKRRKMSGAIPSSAMNSSYSGSPTYQGGSEAKPLLGGNVLPDVPGCTGQSAASDDQECTAATLAFSDTRGGIENMPKRKLQQRKSPGKSEPEPMCATSQQHVHDTHTVRTYLAKCHAVAMLTNDRTLVLADEIHTVVESFDAQTCGSCNNLRGCTLRVPNKSCKKSKL